MDIGVYRLIHFLGIMMLFLSLGGVLQFVIGGGKKAENPWRKMAALTHGIGLFLILLGGFGMLAKLKIGWPWPGWIMAKLAIWVIMGGLLTAAYRRPELGKVFWVVVLLLGFGAALFAGFKPF